MKREQSRRAVLGGLVGAGVVGASLSPVGAILNQFAPLSGTVWESTRTDRPETVTSPYGDASVSYDDEGVPHISADDEQALSFAAGYVQALDRGFQMDLQRRLFSGRLSEVVGESELESDRFHRQMMFQEAAESTAEYLMGTEVEPMLSAYADGVTAGFEEGNLELGFRLLDYEPEPWTVTDTALVEKIISWTLTGSFRTLRKARIREEFGEELAEELYRDRMDHNAPIIREQHWDEEYRLEEAGEQFERPPDASQPAIGDDVVDYLTQFEPNEFLGSNSWVVSEEHAAGDGPLLGNDPHLELTAPPIWYEMHLEGPEHRVRGVAFPGVPTVIIGESDFAAWGFTNAGSDVIDFYRYESDGETYEYGDETLEFEIEEQEIPVSGGDNETVEVKRSVHGPVIEQSGQEVGIAWTGHAATETTLSIYNLTKSTSFDETLDAVSKFDSPTQNFLYADRDGNTLYYTTGQHPIRYTNGEPDSGNRIFDGSAQEGEWGAGFGDGFEPFTRPTWDGFVPFEQQPHVINPDYLSTANQKIIPDEQLDYYFAESYADGYRGERIYDLLDERIKSGEPVDMAFLEELGRDSYDGRAAELVGPLVDAVEESTDDRLAEAAETLDSWEYRMEADERAPLIFALWLDHYRERVLGEPFREAGLSSEYYPSDGRLAALEPESRWFGPQGRAPAMRRALSDALDEIDDVGYEVYGDISNTGVMTHLTELDFLGYPEYPRDGSGYTVWNFGREGPWGGGWEMQVDLSEDGDYLGILAGGNSGRYFDDNYDSQVERWARGEYRRLSREMPDTTDISFEEGSR